MIIIINADSHQWNCSLNVTSELQLKEVTKVDRGISENRDPKTDKKAKRKEHADKACNVKTIVEFAYPLLI